MKWEKSQLVDKTTYIKRGVSPKYVEDDGYVVLNQKCIRENRIDYTPSRLTDKQKNYSEEKILKKGDILINSTGRGTLGRTAQVKDELLDIQFVDTHITIVRAKEDIEPFFLGQLIRNNEPLIESLGKGSTQQLELSRIDLGEIELSFPTLQTQRRIVSVLSAYDDLIENNLKRIKLLEEKAFLRYKQIVVNEKMVSENKLEVVIQTIKRKPKILKSDYSEAGEYPIIDQSTDYIGGYTNDKETVYKDLPMIVFGDHTRILKYVNFPFACGADGTQLIKPKDENICVAYLYFELISCNLTNYHYARHFKFLKEQIVKFPRKEIMHEYKIETDKIFDLIQILRIQNNRLNEALDILLPRLMNGQIEV